MPGKSKIKKPKPSECTRTEEEYQDLRKKVAALARCAMLTLDSRGRLGVGSGMTIDLRTRKVERWETPFFDALDAVGITYDRDKYATSRKKRSRGSI